MAVRQAASAGSCVLLNPLKVAQKLTTRACCPAEGVLPLRAPSWQANLAPGGLDRSCCEFFDLSALIRLAGDLDQMSSAEGTDQELAAASEQQEG